MTQITFDALQKYHKMLTQLLSCHGSMLNDRIPNLNIESSISNPFTKTTKYTNKQNKSVIK